VISLNSRFRRRFALVAVAAAAALSLQGVAAAATPVAPPGNPDVSTINNSSEGWYTAITGSQRVAAEFRVTHAGLLTGFEFALNERNAGRANGSQPLGALVVTLRTVQASGSPSGDVLASTTVPASDVPVGMGSPTLVGVSFPSPPKVAVGKRLYVELSTKTGTVDNGYLWDAYFGPTVQTVSAKTTSQWFSATDTFEYSLGYAQLGFTDYVEAS
jgi:hypothetical protein